MADIRTKAFAKGYLPFEIEVLKDALGITYQNQDNLITELAKAAREQIEMVTRRLLVQQTVVVTIELQDKNVYQIPRSPVISITTVKGQDEDGTQHTMTLNTDYYLRGDSVKMIEMVTIYESYEITMECGYLTSTCPSGLIQAIWKQVQFDSVSRASGALTDEVKKMIQPYIVYG